jgi:hypothetical protein
VVCTAARGSAVPGRRLIAGSGGGRLSSRSRVTDGLDGMVYLVVCAIWIWASICRPREIEAGNLICSRGRSEANF